MSRPAPPAAVLLAVAALAAPHGPALADPGHAPSAPAAGRPTGHMEEMRKMHEAHEHAHDFAALEDVSPERMQRLMEAMLDIGLGLPPLSAARGRTLFAQKGCVLCHEVNGVGAAIGPSLAAADMPSPMNAFEFAARMWRGAPAMVAMQEAELGEVIPLTGQELADLVAFAHDEDEQARLTHDQIPPKFRERLAR